MKKQFVVHLFHKNLFGAGKVERGESLFNFSTLNSQ